MKLFLIAGEASGDSLGAALIAGMRDQHPQLEVQGVGGPKMEAAGVRSLFPMEELSVMGLVEILPRYFDLKRRIAETAAAVVAARPDALITIDSPDFCLRVARAARAAAPALRTIHYVAPTVWAWRPGRAAKMAEVIDHVLALFPFEPPYMEAAGMSCDFVGHPVVADPRATRAEAAAFRAAQGIAADAPLLLCLPGSRRSEVARLGATFGRALSLLGETAPGLRIAIPTVRGVRDEVRALAATWPLAPVVVEEPAAKRAAFAAADLALAASGTVSLELAANRVPMVIAYDFNRLTWWMMKRAALIDTVTLVNIVADSRTVPEFLGPACQPGPIAAALSRLMTDGAARTAQMAAMESTMTRLGAGGEPPGLRAAQSVLAHLQHAGAPQSRT